MNRNFLETLMEFENKAEVYVTELEEDLRQPASVCKACDVTSAHTISARLSEAKTTHAYLSTLLDMYWKTHSKEQP